MTAPLGIIGAGAIGGTLARLALAAGLDVLIANSRGPETLTDLVGKLGSNARAATVREVANEADLVVAAIPLRAHTDLPADALAGRVVLDTTNYYPQRDGQVQALDDQVSTASELVQGHLADSFVVKAFNNITFASLGNGARPAGATGAQHPSGRRRRRRCQAARDSPARHARVRRPRHRPPQRGVA